MKDVPLFFNVQLQSSLQLPTQCSSSRSPAVVVLSPHASPSALNPIKHLLWTNKEVALQRNAGKRLRTKHYLPLPHLK